MGERRCGEMEVGREGGRARQTRRVGARVGGSDGKIKLKKKNR